MEVHPPVRVFCFECGDEIEVVDTQREEDGSLSVSISGACERECQQAAEKSSWAAHQREQQIQERADRLLREERQNAETERFLRDERDRKNKQDRAFWRAMGWNR